MWELSNIFDIIGFIGGILVIIGALVTLWRWRNLAISKGKAINVIQLLLLLFFGVLIVLGKTINLLGIAIPEAFDLTISVIIFVIAVILAMIYLRGGFRI